MTSLAAQTLSRLRAVRDDLAARATDMTDDQLAAASRASEWNVAQVLSHLGSASEIALAGLADGLKGEDPPGQDFNESVWARWDASSDREKADGFIEHSEKLLTALEKVPDDATVKLGFMPMPLPHATVLGMRLSEYALHGWDVTGEPLDAETAEVLRIHLQDGMSFMLGFIGKPEGLSEPVAVKVADLVITIDDKVGLDASATPTATIDAPLEAGIRLINGRLKEDVPVEGNVTLEQLRTVFPGY